MEEVRGHPEDTRRQEERAIKDHEEGPTKPGGREKSAGEPQKAGRPLPEDLGSEEPEDVPARGGRQEAKETVRVEVISHAQSGEVQQDENPDDAEQDGDVFFSDQRGPLSWGLKTDKTPC